jgi:hypothetical protein
LKEYFYDFLNKISIRENNEGMMCDIQAALESLQSEGEISGSDYFVENNQKHVINIRIEEEIIRKSVDDNMTKHTVKFNKKHYIKSQENKIFNSLFDFIKFGNLNFYIRENNNGGIKYSLITAPDNDEAYYVEINIAFCQ